MGVVIHLEIAGMHNHAFRRMNSDADSVIDAGSPDKFDLQSSRI